MVAVQAAAPLFDSEIRGSRLPLSIVVLQGSLFALSLLLGAMAHRSDAFHGGAAMNALIKSLAPLICVAIKFEYRPLYWVSALLSCVGIVIASTADGLDELATGAISAYALLGAATLCGVALGLVQERHGHCWREMALVSTLICVAVAVLDTHQVSADLIWQASLYGTVSFFVQRSMRHYSLEVHQSAFWISMALNERRAVTVALGALNSAAPLRLLAGAALTLSAVQLQSLVQRNRVGE